MNTITDTINVNVDPSNVDRHIHSLIELSIATIELSGGKGLKIYMKEQLKNHYIFRGNEGKRRSELGSLL